MYFSNSFLPIPCKIAIVFCLNEMWNTLVINACRYWQYSNHFSYRKYNFIIEMFVSHGIFSNFIYPSTYIVNLPYIFAIVETTKGAV